MLTNYDIVADVGHHDRHDEGHVITAASDGNVHIDFGHVVENPLINGIEIVAPTCRRARRRPRAR